MKHSAALLGTAEDLHKANQPKPSSFYGAEIEDYLDLNFGIDTWVRDPYEDKYVVWTGEGNYLVIDREFRRYPVSIPPSRLQ